MNMITIEGLDCVGKTTLIKSISDKYSDIKIIDKNDVVHNNTNEELKEDSTNNSSIKKYISVYIDNLNYGMSVINTSPVILDRSLLTTFLYAYIDYFISDIKNVYLEDIEQVEYAMNNIISIEEIFTNYIDHVNIFFDTDNIKVSNTIILTRDNQERLHNISIKDHDDSVGDSFETNTNLQLRLNIYLECFIKAIPNINNTIHSDLFGEFITKSVFESDGNNIIDEINHLLRKEK